MPKHWVVRPQVLSIEWMLLLSGPVWLESERHDAKQSSKPSDLRGSRSLRKKLRLQVQNQGSKNTIGWSSEE
jgi:hypothetical protein